MLAAKVKHWELSDEEFCRVRAMAAICEPDEGKTSRREERRSEEIERWASTRSEWFVGASRGDGRRSTRKRAAGRHRKLEDNRCDHSPEARVGFGKLVKQ
jgi:hypothetical protein